MADLVTCAHCGKQCADGLTWCPFCGEELASLPAPDVAPPMARPDTREPADVAPIPQPTYDYGPVREAPSVAACESCERQIDPRLTWCPYCGEETGYAPEAPADASPEVDEPATPEPPEEIDPPPPPPPRRSGRPLGVDGTGGRPDFDHQVRKVRRSQIAGVVMSLLVIVGALAAVIFIFTLVLRSDGDNTVTNQPATDGIPQQVFTDFTPTPGDCVVYQPDGEIVREDCATAHSGEVFGTLGYSPTAVPFPGDQALASYADEECLARFSTYVGTDYWASGLTFVYIYPTAEGWADGDRNITCVIEDPLSAPLTTPVRASGGVDHAGYLPFRLLTAGTCWDLVVGGAELVLIVDCAMPHDAETFASVDFPTEVFPVDAVAVGDEECAAHYDAYVSAAAADATDWVAAVPTALEWRYGYRVITCTLFQLDGGKATGSVRG